VSYFSGERMYISLQQETTVPQAKPQPSPPTCTLAGPDAHIISVKLYLPDVLESNRSGETSALHSEISIIEVEII